VAEALKKQFGEAVVDRLAHEIHGSYAQFRVKQFVHDALEGFEQLELLDRARHLARVLQRHLPAEYPAALDVLLATLPAAKSPLSGMASFFYLPHTEFVRQFGLAHFDESMRAAHALTQHFTAEWALRPFLEQHAQRTIAVLDGWTTDTSEHVRRLVSESTRPRLPWAPYLRNFQQDPSPVLALLEKLRDDESLYVRRSVANNLNDIGKDNPRLLLETATRWLKNASEERRWIVTHALRTAVKRGDPDALRLLGFGVTAKLGVTDIVIHPPRPRLGTNVTVTCALTNSTRRGQDVIADLLIHFVKANGSTNPKVFKLAKVTLAPGSSTTLQKTISLAALTTRQHYPGEHRVELQLNGAITPLGSFTLRA
jgi:3-methyladenine DNA glycosylase AlkC